MFTAVSAGLITFTLWVVLISIGFIGVGVITAAGLSRLLPKGQERLPRWVATTFCIATSALAGSSAGIQVGLVQASLSFGDSIIAEERIILSPRFSADSLGQYINDLSRHTKVELHDLTQSGVARYVAGHFALGSMQHPVMAAWDFGEAYLNNRDPHGVWSWQAARADMELTAMRKTGLSVLVGLAHFASQAALALLLIVFSRNEIKSGCLPPQPRTRKQQG